MADPKLVVKQILDNNKFKKGLKESQSAAQQFSSSVKTIGVAVAAAFSVQQIIEFATKMAEVGHVANNVDKAFRKLGLSLEELQSATGGGIGKTRLEQMAIQAKNLGLPIQDLATYFKFATIRAAETGQSVDYLVNSIVTGIGRKSVLILDNLGISSVRLQEEMAKTGDFGQAAGNIIREEMEKSTLSVEDAVSGVQHLKTAWENLETKVAQGGVGSMFSNMADELAQVVDAFNSVGGNGSGLYAKQIEETARTIASLQQAIAEKGPLKYYTDKLAEAVAWMQELQKKAAETEKATKALTDAQKQDAEELASAELKAKKAKELLNEQLAIQHEMFLLTHDDLGKAIDLFDNYGSKVTETAQEIEDALMKMTEAWQNEGYIDDIPFATDEVAAGIEDSSKTIESSMARIGNSMGDALAEFAKGEATFKETAFKIIGSIIKIVAGYLAQSVASSFAGGASAGGPAAPFTGAAAAATAASLFGSIVPALLAEGGTVPGGFPNDSYPAMLSSGETVVPAAIPLNLGGGGYDQISAKVRGEDIYMVWQKQQSKQDRYK